MNSIKKMFFCLFLFMLCFSLNSKVEGALDTYVHTKSSGWVPYASNTYGANLHYHYFNGNIPAYCMQWNYSSANGVTYSLYNNPTYISETKRYIVGTAINILYNKDPNHQNNYTDDQRYVYATQIANCVFAVPGSYCSSAWKDYKEFVRLAEEKVKTREYCSGVNTSGCFGSDNFKLSIANNNYTLNKISGTNNFISGKITLNGLLQSYGGEGTDYTISVTNCPSGSTCKICSDAGGKTCETSKNLKNPTSSSDNFYIKVENGTSNGVIKIKARGTNSAGYSYSYVYSYSDGTQKMVIPEVINLNREVSKTMTLNLPAEHSVTAVKVDEDGEELKGAEFEIYRASDSEGKNRVGSSLAVSNGTARAAYTETADIGNWSNYYYCFVESRPPVGYILGSGDNTPLCIKPSTTNTSLCYKNSDHSQTDITNCGSYSYYCPSGTLLGDVNKCQITNSAGSYAPTVCPSDYSYDEDNKICSKEEAFSEESNEEGEEGSAEGNVVTTNPVCNGEDSLIGGECYHCDAGYSFDSESKSCFKSEDAKCKNGSGTDVSVSYCQNRPNYELVNISSDGNISFVKVNRKNSVSISKTDVTGENELYGAKMKVCTTKPDANLNCVIATVGTGNASTELSWVSGSTPKVWRGLEANKTYYLVETVAPLGYVISQYTTFSVGEDGTIVSEGTTVVDNKILVKNDLNNFTVSKQDATTSKELPGAKLKICMMSKNEKNNYELVTPEDAKGKRDCVIASLSDGSLAEWTSTDKPHSINGLAAGTYGLVEEIAPDGYAEAEMVIFKMTENGTLTDVNGKALKDNKLVMLDNKIKQVPTGNTIAIVVGAFGFLALGVGIFYYFKYYKKK